MQCVCTTSHGGIGRRFRLLKAILFFRRPIIPLQLACKNGTMKCRFYHIRIQIFYRCKTPRIRSFSFPIYHSYRSYPHLEYFKQAWLIRFHHVVEEFRRLCSTDCVCRHIHRITPNPLDRCNGTNSDVRTCSYIALSVSFGVF